MKEIIDEYEARSRRSTWIYLGALMVIGIVAVFLATWLNRADVQRRLDASVVKMVQDIHTRQDQIRASIERLSAENQRSMQDRAKIHSTVDQLKSEVKGVQSEVKSWP